MAKAGHYAPAEARPVLWLAQQPSANFPVDLAHGADIGDRYLFVRFVDRRVDRAELDDMSAARRRHGRGGERQRAHAPAGKGLPARVTRISSGFTGTFDKAMVFFAMA